MPRRSAADLALVRPAVDGEPSRVRPPDGLTADERKLWHQIVNGCSPQHFRDVDTPLLTRYVECSCLAARASRELKASGVISEEGAVNPWLLPS